MCPFFPSCVSLVNKNYYLPLQAVPLLQLLLFSNFQGCGLRTFSWSLVPHELWSIAAAWSFKHHNAAAGSTKGFSAEEIIIWFSKAAAAEGMAQLGRGPHCPMELVVVVASRFCYAYLLLGCDSNKSEQTSTRTRINHSTVVWARVWWTSLPSSEHRAVLCPVCAVTRHIILPVWKDPGISCGGWCRKLRVGPQAFMHLGVTTWSHDHPRQVCLCSWQRGLHSQFPSWCLTEGLELSSMQPSLPDQSITQVGVGAVRGMSQQQSSKIPALVGNESQFWSSTCPRTADWAGIVQKGGILLHFHHQWWPGWGVCMPGLLADIAFRSACLLGVSVWEGTAVGIEGATRGCCSTQYSNACNLWALKDSIPSSAWKQWKKKYYELGWWCKWALSGVISPCVAALAAGVRRSRISFRLGTGQSFTPLLHPRSLPKCLAPL